MTSIGEVLAEVMAARAQLSEVTGLAAHGKELTDQAAAMLAEVSDGTYDETVMDVLALVLRASTCAENAAARVRETERALARYHAIVAGTSAVSIRLPGDRPRPAGLKPADGYDRDKAEEIRAFTDDPKTVGRLYDDHGRPIGTLIFSGERGPGAGGPDLHGRWKLLTSLTEHAEGHAAALIRKRKIRNAVLYLNNAPCRGTAGCYNNLAAALPAGVRITIWVVNGDGSILRVRRTGTGEALQP